MNTLPELEANNSLSVFFTNKMNFFSSPSLYFIEEVFSCPLTNCIQLFLESTNVKGASSIEASISS